MEARAVPGQMYYKSYSREKMGKKRSGVRGVSERFGVWECLNVTHVLSQMARTVRKVTYYQKHDVGSIDGNLGGSR